MYIATDENGILGLYDSKTNGTFLIHSILY